MNDIEIMYWPMKSPEDPASHWPGYHPNQKTLLKKGDHYDTDGEPFPCDIIYERDIPVTLADGTVIDIDVFRPVTDRPVPCIMAWHSFGKTLLPDAGRPDEEFMKLPFAKQMLLGINADAKLSGLETRMGPDPADWVNRGYAVCSPDPRGVYHSQGNMQYFGSQYGKDGADVVEYLARQEWCSGKIGLTGTHWSAIAAWFIAAEQPEHLAAMFIVEGHGRFYEDEMVRGGIPQLDWNNRNRSFGYGMIEDIAGMSEKYPLYNEYWADKDAHFENVKCPLFQIPSFIQTYHSNSVFKGFNMAQTENKWMHVHNGLKNDANPYRYMKHQNECQEFFDYFLMGLDNGWDKTPKIRLGILDPGHEDISDRVVDNFPPSGYVPQEYYLNSRNMLLDDSPIVGESSISYSAEDGAVRFSTVIDEDTEVVGYSKIRLWLEADGSDDMDIFVRIDKLDSDGHKLIAYETKDYSGPNGKLRVSHRALDPEKSTELEPFHPHNKEELLLPGQIVPVEIAIWPTAMLFHKGEQLSVEISGHGLKVAHAGYDNIVTRNRGNHIIHSGGKYDSKLVIPIKRI